MFWYRLISFDRNIHHSVSFRNCSKIVQIVFFVNLRIFWFLDLVSIFGGLFNTAVKNEVNYWNVVIQLLDGKMYRLIHKISDPFYFLDLGNFVSFWDAYDFILNNEKGDTLEIPCIASGIPEPKMMWINVEEQKIISKDKNLYIETVRPSDTGAYTCVAKVSFDNFWS